MLLDLRDPAVRRSAGLDSTPPPTKAHRPRYETRALIMAAVRDSFQPLTRSDIFEAIGRRKTPYGIEIVRSLVEDGHLIEQAMPYRSNACVYIYQAANNDMDE